MLSTEKKEGLDFNSSPFYYNGYASKDLTLANSEHLSATSRAYALSRRSTILHGYTLGILHLFLRATLYTISLHLLPPL